MNFNLMETAMTRNLMNLKDLSDYLQVPETKIKRLMDDNQIPFHDTLGTPRFFREEIDAWIKAGASKEKDRADEGQLFFYRGKPILDYKLTCSRVLIGRTPLERLPRFIRDACSAVDKSENDFLFRKEFEPLIKNFNDYLRLSCQLGLINNVRVGKISEYYLTDYARQVRDAEKIEGVRAAIRDSVWDIVKNGKETLPQERHAVFLIWYLLKLKSEGIEPTEKHFDKGSEKNFYPKIRLDYTKGLCEYIFGGDTAEEARYFDQWNKLCVS
jgi:excisionase family DNA binding protein